MRSLSAWLVFLAACGGAPPAPQPVPSRTVCGWESLEDVLPRARHPGEPPPPKVAGPERLSLGSESKSAAAAGTRVLVLDVEPQVTFGALRAALAPAADSLVRIKVLFNGGWLLPLTARGRVPVTPPPKSETVESVVGRRILRRPRGAPADRFADLRVDGGLVRLYVENENPAGTRLRVSGLPAALRRIEPPATVFALTATDGTRWQDVEEALVAAACYDRRPGEEPHEVILD